MMGVNFARRTREIDPPPSFVVPGSSAGSDGTPLGPPTEKTTYGTPDRLLSISILRHVGQLCGQPLKRMNDSGRSSSLVVVACGCPPPVDVHTAKPRQSPGRASKKRHSRPVQVFRVGRRESPKVNVLTI